MTTHQNFEGPGQLTLLQYKNDSKNFMISFPLLKVKDLTFKKNVITSSKWVVLKTILLFHVTKGLFNACSLDN